MSETLKQKLDELLDELYFLQSDWSDLGWDRDGCPESEECDKVDEKLMRINRLREEVRELLKKEK